MFLSLTALALVLFQQDKAVPIASKTDKPAAAPVDRSAEPALKALFADSGALRGVHIEIQSYSYDEGSDRYSEDSSTNLWLGDGGRVRWQNSSDTWGGGSLLISDGESLLSDDMSDDSAIRISKPAKTLHELNDQELILYALEGQGGFDALVEKDQPLKVVGNPSGGEQVIEIHSKKLGKVLLHYRAGSALPTQIDSYQVPWWSDDPTAAPAKPTSVQKLRVISHGAMDSRLFRVSAPKGKKVTDERAKKPEAGA